MAGFLMQRGEVDLVIVGADRIAANGDTANKIGTYTIAVLARAHGIPLYIAAPLSTIDPSLADGGLIPIEERDPAELTHCGGVRTAPEGISVWNPAFDVTPHDLITAIVTEAGVIRPPFAEGIRTPGRHRPESIPFSRFTSCRKGSPARYLLRFSYRISTVCPCRIPGR